jgi:hypothetical protein
MFLQRPADAILLPEARTTVKSKRARRRKIEQQHGDCIVVSLKSMENHVQTTKEAKHPNGSPASEASRAASQSDGVDCQSNRQNSNEDSNALQKRLALLAVEASRWTTPCQDNTPPDSRIESNGASTHSPTSDSPPLGITEGDITGLSGQAKNLPNNTQPPPPSLSSSHDSQGPPASSERPSSSSALVETGQDLGRSWTSDRVSSSLQKVSTVEIERQLSMSGPFRASSTAGTGRSASKFPFPHNRLETFTNELRTTSRPSNPRLLPSMAQHISPTDFCRAFPNTLNQASTQEIGVRSQSFQPQMITSTDPARGNDPSNSLNASQHPEPANHLESRTVDIPSSNATIPAADERDNHQEQPHSQGSSYRPALRFLTDNNIDGALPWTEMKPYIEKFSRNGHVFLRPKKTPTENKVYPVDVIMWPQSRDFHRWYMTETGTTEVSTLRFEILDAKLNLENMFCISGGDAHLFPTLRQYIWDFFWVASSLNNASTFKVVVRAVHHLPIHAFSHDRVEAECDATASVLPAGHSTSSRARNIRMVADSQPPAAIMSQVHDGYPPHNEATAHKISSIAPPVSALKNDTTAQMHFPEVKYPGSSSLTQGTSTWMGVAPNIPSQHQPEDVRGLSSRQTAIAALLDPEISVRVQTDGAGKVSTRYSKWVLRPEITTTDFFAWFAQQTGRGRSEGPPSLRFTFKDAMPAPTSSTIAQANEDHFNLMKRDLKAQFEKAKEFVPNLKEFLVVVTDPGWVSEDEYW